MSDHAEEQKHQDEGDRAGGVRERSGVATAQAPSGSGASNNDSIHASAISASTLMVKPKRQLTAYNIFFQQERRRLLDEIPDKNPETGRRRKNRSTRRAHGKIGFADLGRMIAAKWRELSDGEKEYYNQLAARDKVRHAIETQIWEETHGTSAGSSSNTNDDTDRRTRSPVPPAAARRGRSDNNDAIEMGVAAGGTAFAGVLSIGTGTGGDEGHHVTIFQGPPPDASTAFNPSVRATDASFLNASTLIEQSYIAASVDLPPEAQPRPIMFLENILQEPTLLQVPSGSQQPPPTRPNVHQFLLDQELLHTLSKELGEGGKEEVIKVFRTVG